MYVLYNDRLLIEGDDDYKMDLTRDDSILINKYTTYPQGFFIYDSVNNPFYPIPWIKLDSDKFDTIELFQRYKENYTKVTGALMLPWHFTIDLVRFEYFVVNTRPLNLKFPITTLDFKKYNKNYKTFNSEFSQFLIQEPFDLSEGIHIVIIGDSHLDVYPKKFYNAIVRFCIDPFVRYFRIPKSYITRIIPINLGKKIIFDKIIKTIRI